MEPNETNALEEAVQKGDLLESALKNIIGFTEYEGMPEWVGASLSELIEQSKWDELNDRFYKNLSFGTGGMRGRTIGRVVTEAERGGNAITQTPKYAAVGSNTLNEITLIRATKALCVYLKQWMAEQGAMEQPRLVVAHDVRHFSQ